ncbi:MAG: branched-chain-amino-acid transaminase [Elusimicrobia bacterium RIFCSPLOWO2_02_FULL_39_32]|nr:MAG: branched-chain-amino-acid transaminase [Elusimicrobia bacterium GWA2_38_7]OGR79516.1 MAG: branched-chain-amino-acid transaminase [Elusimicrobia bacterium RIFCSPHIGHO2_02_FULL_39_36]OGR92842.1 MAG: branched-chain-amino-acid transaminase [Elusimicrobia bacterium RIFCSPLOWO2_02_FULL_39_32]OGR99627.1 MAG: branched-chain-amino-acid transaminase [Elusimicrobia bacterium RIFCSPLOWO2_12_FULL_39_28]
MKIYLNGKFYAKDQAKISVFDHGLLYGDGVFEGIRAYNGKVFKLKEHLKRLYHSARAITLNIPLKIDELEKTILETLKINGLKDAYIRLVITRGEGDLGLDPRKCPKSSVLIIADKITLYPEKLYKKGLDLVTVATKRNISEALNPCIKSLNYLNNIMAKIEANRANAPEAIMLNKDGYVAECTGDNIFIVMNQSLITPPCWAGALDGITRATVIELAKNKLKIPTKEELFTPYNIYTADEVFLTGTAAEVIPVTKVDNRIIGEGHPGKITQKLIQEFKILTHNSGTPIY